MKIKILKLLWRFVYMSCTTLVVMAVLSTFLNVDSVFWLSHNTLWLTSVVAAIYSYWRYANEN